MSHFFTLPNDILLCIADCVYLHEHAQSRLSRMTRTCRHLHTLLLGHLYRRNLEFKLGRAIMFLTKHGHEAALRRMLDEADKLSPQRQREWTFALGHYPIRTAAEKGNNDIVKLLLERGAAINQFNHNWYNRYPEEIDKKCDALVHAAEQGHIEVVKTMLAAGAALNITKYPYCPAMLAAIRRGQVDVISVLLEAGADISSNSEVVKQAVALGNRDILRALVTAMNRPANPRDRYRVMALAAKDGNYKAMENMLGASQRQDSRHCFWASSYAERNGHQVIVALLKPFIRPRESTPRKRI